MAGTGPVQEVPIMDARHLNDDVIHRDRIRAWLAWGFFWLLLFRSVGVILSTKFNYSEIICNDPWLTLGRLRRIRVNGVMWGAFSQLFIGLCDDIVDRITG